MKQSKCKCKAAAFNPAMTEIQGAKETIDGLLRLLKGLPRDGEFLSLDCLQAIKKDVQEALDDAITDIESAKSFII